MSLMLDSLSVAGAPPVHVRIPDGVWAVVRHPEPDALIDVLAGLREGVGGVVLLGRELRAVPPAERTRLGLGVVFSRLPELPGVLVREVLQIAMPGGPGPFAAMAGTRGARTAMADQEASVRSLAGRMGISRWLDREAVGLLPGIAAHVDAVRALAAAPSAVVWRRPEWLPPQQQQGLLDVLAEEHARVGMPLVEVTSTSR